MHAAHTTNTLSTDLAMIPPGRDFLVSTAARLHFGLLDTAAPFGGVGMMLSGPKTEVMFQKSRRFEVACPANDEQCKERVRAIANRLQHVLGLSELPQYKVTILQRPEPHTGLGTGTQLAMATAEGLALSVGAGVEMEVLASQIAGRGLRSAVGIHGYYCGGFIYEASLHGQASLNPVVTRIAVPSEWKIVIWRPRQLSAIVAGTEEVAKFAELPRPTAQERASLRAILLDQVIPSLQQNNFIAWATSITEYNRCSGMFFAAAQGGPYNGESTDRFVRHLQTHGVVGAGQSSWGPSVFALFDSDTAARGTLDLANDEWEPMAIYSPSNTGRLIKLLD